MSEIWQAWVERELDIAEGDDIPAYASGRELVKVAGRVASLDEGRHLRLAAQTVALLILESLRAEVVEHELAKLRQAELAVALVRGEALKLHREGAMTGPAFDAVAVVAARTRREVVDMIQRTRHRAWAQVHGMAWAKASSRRVSSDPSSSSSQKR